MNNESDPHPLEGQLRREAQAIFARHGRPGSAAVLAAEHRRRAKVRRVRQAGAAAIVAVSVCGAFLAGAWRDRDVRDAPIAASPAPKAPAAIQDRPPAPPRIVATETYHEDDAPPAALSDGPIPFLLTGPGESGEAVIAVGVYIPPHVERINLHDLPPLQQAAVRRVLEIEEVESKPTI